MSSFISFNFFLIVTEPGIKKEKKKPKQFLYFIIYQPNTIAVKRPSP